MKLGHLALVLAVAAAFPGAGCQDNWESLFIHDNKQLSDPPECKIPIEESATAQLGGVMDVARTSTYVGYLFVENALIPRSDPGIPRAESNGIFIQGAYLTYEADPNRVVAYTPVETRFTAFVDAGGFYTVGTVMIPYTVGRQLAGALDAAPALSSMQITVTVQFFGQTQAGIDVLSQPFDYPITICRGCLSYCPLGVDLAPDDPGCQCDCTNETVEMDDPPCHPGQDTPYDCRIGPPCLE